MSNKKMSITDLSDSTSSCSTYSASSLTTTSNGTSNTIYVNGGTLGSSGIATTLAWDDSWYGTGKQIMETTINVLKELEVSELLDKVISRNKDKSSVRSVISWTVRNRHFSEEFLIRYSDYLNITDIMVMHSPDIQSGEYSQLALMFELQK